MLIPWYMLLTALIEHDRNIFKGGSQLAPLRMGMFRWEALIFYWSPIYMELFCHLAVIVFSFSEIWRQEELTEYPPYLSAKSNWYDFKAAITGW